MHKGIVGHVTNRTLVTRVRQVIQFYYFRLKLCGIQGTDGHVTNCTLVRQARQVVQLHN